MFEEAKKIFVERICWGCAESRGGWMAQGHLANWKLTRCDVCKKEREVVHPFDFNLRYVQLEN